MLYCGMARLSALLGKVDRLFMLHLLSHRDFTLAELGRATGRSRRQVETFVAELEAAGIVVSGHGRGPRLYNLASDEIRLFIASLVAPGMADLRQHGHLKLVHARGDLLENPQPTAEPMPHAKRGSVALRAVPTGS